MAKRKLDNIERDVIAAMELGYGVHYGNYKADHPNTKEPEEDSIPDPEEYGSCRNCGKPFPRRGYRYRKLYCDDDCRLQYNKKLAHGGFQNDPVR